MWPEDASFLTPRPNRYGLIAAVELKCLTEFDIAILGIAGAKAIDAIAQGESCVAPLLAAGCPVARQEWA